jgi:hypothetical protein
MTQRYMHISPKAIESAIRLLDRGNTVATEFATAENVNDVRRKMVAGAGFEPATFGL